MQTLIDILLIILILSATALCVFTILFLKNIIEQVGAVRKDIRQLVENTIPVLINLEKVTERTNRIAGKAEVYWDEIENSIRILREKILKFGSWKKFCDTHANSSKPIKNLISIAKGISVFWNAYKHK